MQLIPSILGTDVAAEMQKMKRWPIRLRVCRILLSRLMRWAFAFAAVIAAGVQIPLGGSAVFSIGTYDDSLIIVVLSSQFVSIL